MIPYVSDHELEQRALGLISAFEGLDGPISPPVPVELIIEHVLDIDIDWCELPRSDSGGRILAAVEQTPTGTRVLMNELERSFFDQYFGTREYSLAHEAGHAVLHLQRGEMQQASLLDPHPTVLCRTTPHDRIEIQAERFAAFLLMPEYLLRGAVGTDSLTTWTQIYALRDQFGVSVTAMTRRLRELDLACVHDGRVFPNVAAASGQLPLA